MLFMTNNASAFIKKIGGCPIDIVHNKLNKKKLTINLIEIRNVFFKIYIF